MREKTELYIGLDDGPFKDQFTRVGFWHSLFRTHLKAIPNALFMGGTFDKAYLALFRRPLVPSDFTELWSLSLQREATRFFVCNEKYAVIK